MFFFLVIPVRSSQQSPKLASDEAIWSNCEENFFTGSYFLTLQNNAVVTSLKGYLKVGFYYSYENKLNKPCLIMIAVAFTIWLILFHQLKPFFSSFILTLCTRKSAKYESQKTGTITVNISLTNVAIFFYSHHKCRNCL